MEAKRSSMKLLFADLRSKRKTWWVPHEINHVFSVTKHLFSVVCFKSKSNHRNKHPQKMVGSGSTFTLLPPCVYDVTNKDLKIRRYTQQVLVSFFFFSLEDLFFPALFSLY
jgi:hypothetical protein